MTPRRIGLMGGTFDPIHWGHLDAALAAESALDLMRVLLITSKLPPHRHQPFASSFHRFAMTSMAVAGRTGWRAADLELRQDAPSYTASTLRKFHERGYAASELFFIIGADAFTDIMSWKGYPDILDYCHFAVVSRPDHPAYALANRLPRLGSRMARPPIDVVSQIDPLIILIDAPTSAVSSSAIREKRARGESIAGLVPDAVAEHIEQHGLYSSPSPGRRAADAVSTPAAGRLHGQQ